MAVRAIRGAVQVDANERAAILEGTTELVTAGDVFPIEPEDALAPSRHPGESA